MAFTNDWTISNNPADHSKFKDIPSFVRKVRTDVEERLTDMVYGFATGETEYGIKQLLFKEQGSDPAAPTDAIRLYAKNDGTSAELYTRHESAGVTQLTRLGKIIASAIGYASSALGDFLYHDGTNLVRLAGNTTTVQKVLAQTGNGSVSAAPVWTEISESGVGGSFRNLSVSRTNATTVAITADELIVRSVAGVVKRITSVSVSPAITTSGANGLDAGVEAANTIYYLWVIRKSSDGTIAGLISAASDIGSITFPSGYDQAALVSAVGNDNSSNFINFRQTGRRYTFNQWGTLHNADTSGAWASVDLTPSNMTTNACFVPSALSNYCYGSIYSLANDKYIAVTNDNTVANQNDLDRNKITNYTYGTQSRAWALDVLTADTIYVVTNAGSGYLYLQGFEINKLG